MKFPWSTRQAPRRAEHRQGYTDLITEAILARQNGAVAGTPQETSGAEFAAALYASGFAAAKVLPENAVTRSVTPDVLASIGRSLIIDGEGVFLVDVDQGEVQLLPASQWDIVGGVRPSSWVYILQLQGPTHPEVARASSADVVHVKYSIDPLRPWKGIGPLARASSTGRLAGNLEKSLGQEAGTPVGQLIPIPIDGEDSDSDTDPLADLKSLKGDLGLVETTAAGFGQGRDFAPHGDWQPRRIGASTASGCF